MAGNFDFLSDPILKKRAERIETDLLTGEYHLGAQGLRPLLKGYIREFQLKALAESEKGILERAGLARLLGQLSNGFRFDDNVWAFINEAAHCNLEGYSTEQLGQLVVQALAEIHRYMGEFPARHTIPSFDRNLYQPELSERAAPKKERDIRKTKLPELSDVRVKAFESLRDERQMQELAKFFDREGLRDKVDQELEELLEQIEQKYETDFPYAEEQRNLQYYEGLEAAEFLQELHWEKTSGGGAWQQIPEQAQKAWQAEVERWQAEYESKKTKELVKQKKQGKNQLPAEPQIKEPNFTEWLAQVPKHEQQTLQNYMLQEWFRSFVRKREQWLQQQIDAERKKYLRQLQQQMEQFEKLKEILQPFGSGLGRLWDMSKGDLRHINWDILQYYEQLLAREQSLKELAELLGRYRRAEHSYEKKLIEVRQEIPVRAAIYGQGGRRIGIEYGNRLNRLVPREFLSLADEESELLFLLKYSQKRLLQYKTALPVWDTDTITAHKEEEQAKETDQGPFILCVDTSGSMHGYPEQTAKMLCYVLARFAAQNKRKLFLINFSTEIECLDLSSITRSLKALIDFLCLSFHGGTDITPAVRKALELMAQENYQKADLLLISDGLFPSLSPADQVLVEQQKQQDSKFYSLMIGSSALSDALNIFDENWSYNRGEKKKKEER